ncbi:MAG: DNA topoisomerase I [Halobacteriota archaeon]|nr:DNA topoisomerase I [Halobacteriota archaeon]
MEYIITEKHSTAKRIAGILSEGKVKEKKISGVDSFEFDGRAVIGLSGHIVGVDFPERYRRWNDVNPGKLIDSQIVSIPVQKKFINALKKIAKDASHITIATDFDREGEFIGVEALRVICEVNPDVAVDRVRYSAITKSEIEKAFDEPSEVDFNLAAASEARQTIDLIWGSVLTRYVSLSSRQFGKDFLSVGRVQSPTLALLVNREKEIENFVPETYWEIHAKLRNKESFTAKHKKGRISDKGEAESIISKLGRDGVVITAQKKEKREKPPRPFDTTEFIRAASSIGYSAANAMRLAEGLYINGFTSYPRTDNTVYPKSLDLKSIVEMFIDSEFEEYAQKLQDKELKPTFGKKETTDHPPIHPVSVADKKDLNEDHWAIYELITRRFFATLADPTIWNTMKIEVDINEEIFKASGSRIIDEGWRWFYPYNPLKERVLPELKEGDKLVVEGVDLLEKETQPPTRYGQGRLIKKMEDLGLGTKSTRHEMLSKLYARAYVHGNPLKPTKKAYAVIDSLETYAEMITKPDMTSLLEKDMDKITQGEISQKDVVKESKDMLREIYKNLEANRSEISESLRGKLREESIVGECPDCGSELIIRKSRKGSRFVGCSGFPGCTFTLPLPRDGQLIVTEDKCEEHGLHHVHVITGRRKPFELGCPQCNFIKWQESKAKEKEE